MSRLLICYSSLLLYEWYRKHKWMLGAENKNMITIRLPMGAKKKDYSNTRLRKASISHFGLRRKRYTGGRIGGKGSYGGRSFILTVAASMEAEHSKGC